MNEIARNGKKDKITNNSFNNNKKSKMNVGKNKKQK